MADFEIQKGYIPGIIGRVAELHALYYSRNWHFGVFFEAKVAREMAEFMDAYNSERDGLWSFSINGRIEGAIAIDGSSAQDKGAHLRWFIVSDNLQGKGAGKILINEAVSFCKSKQYKKVYLWTFDGLLPARHLYEKAGFRLVEENTGTKWGKEVTQQKFEIRLP